MAIACLHTMESNQPIFEEAFADVGVGRGHELRHAVREDLLRAAGEAGGVTEEILDETREVLRALMQDSQAVLLTCSTLGSAVEGLSETGSCPVLRVDEALAQATFAAARRAQGHPLLVLCTTETTLGPTGALFENVGQGQGFDMKVVSEAWNHFFAGDLPAYLQSIAQAADDAAREGYGVIAFAQASMAPAAALCQVARPLTSPGAGLSAVLRKLERQD